ncbi:MAG: 30S ribosomal protein S16 [Deltaproteobacteria bacterium]|nr:30S ribosomal protein S16 [Deltaproteobacteria bacterium]
MAVKIRLARAGAKKHPYYHVVAADSRSPRDGKFIEAFGSYDPTAKPHKLDIDNARLEHWLKCGAQPTETVGQLIKEHKRAQPAAAAAKA